MLNLTRYLDSNVLQFIHSLNKLSNLRTIVFHLILEYQIL